MRKSFWLGTFLLLALSARTFAAGAEMEGLVSADNVNFRSGPTLTATIVDGLKLGDAVTILGTQKPWVKVRLADQREGWISEQYVVIGNVDRNSLRALRGGTEIVSRARSFMGTRYIYGGGTGRGFDCSGFTMYVYRQLGIELPHNAAAQMGKGTSVSREELRPGDLVFFATMGSPTVNHVGIYIGEGDFIHASSGFGAVRISPLSEGYYNVRYRGARRILENVPAVFKDTQSADN